MVCEHLLRRGEKILTAVSLHEVQYWAVSGGDERCPICGGCGIFEKSNGGRQFHQAEVNSGNSNGGGQKDRLCPISGVACVCARWPFAHGCILYRWYRLVPFACVRSTTPLCLASAPLVLTRPVLRSSCSRHCIIHTLPQPSSTSSPHYPSTACCSHSLPPTISRSRSRSRSRSYPFASLPYLSTRSRLSHVRPHRAFVPLAPLSSSPLSAPFVAPSQLFPSLAA